MLVWLLQVAELSARLGNANASSTGLLIHLPLSLFLLCLPVCRCHWPGLSASACLFSCLPTKIHASSLCLLISQSVSLFCKQSMFLLLSSLYRISVVSDTSIYRCLDWGRQNMQKKWISIFLGIVSLKKGYAHCRLLTLSLTCTLVCQGKKKTNIVSVTWNCSFLTKPSHHCLFFTGCFSATLSFWFPVFIYRWLILPWKGFFVALCSAGVVCVCHSK